MARRPVLAAAVLLPALLVPASSSFADTVTVTSTADSGAGTLRAAISAAAPGDTIDFAVGGTIALDSELVVDKSLRIDGPGARGLRLSGQGGTRVLHVDAPGAEVAVGGLTISDGFADGQEPLGGGLLVSRASGVRLTGVALLDNVAHRSEDVVALGGGVAALRGSLEIARSTVAGNRTTPDGGGGGVFVGDPATFAIGNSTVTGNDASAGGGLLAGSTGTVTSTTFASNTATSIGPAIGVMPGSGVTLTGSLVTANGCDGAIASGGGNVADATCLATPAAGDAIAPAAPVSGLGDHGGPTDTLLPLAGSPAIDRSAGPCPDTDQRGVARPQGGGCDAGAVELEVDAAPPAPAIDVPPPAPPVATDPVAASAHAFLLRTSSRAARSGRFEVRLACKAVNAVGCAGKVTLKLSKKRKLSRSFVVIAGKRTVVTLRLSRRDRARLAQRRSIRSAVTIVTRQPDGSRTTTHTGGFKLRR